jgi:telomere length regulation protein
LVKEIYSSLLLQQTLTESFALLIGQLRQTEQVAFIEAIFRDVQRTHFSGDLSGSVGQAITSSETVKAVAALCTAVVSCRPNLEPLVVEWLSKSQGGSITTLGLRRALLATYSNRSGQSLSNQDGD